MCNYAHAPAFRQPLPLSQIDNVQLNIWSSLEVGVPQACSGPLEKSDLTLGLTLLDSWESTPSSITEAMVS